MSDAVPVSEHRADGRDLQELLDDEPCFTEEEFRRLGLLPVPDWARRPPDARRDDYATMDGIPSPD